MFVLYAGLPQAQANSLEVADRILEVNGRCLENATHIEAIQYIHRVIIVLYIAAFLLFSVDCQTCKLKQIDKQDIYIGR